MSDQAELIVEFRRGVPEADARAVVEGESGTVRRRMRTDHDDQVTLLIRLATDRAGAAKKALDAHGSVTRTESNGKDFSIL